MTAEGLGLRMARGVNPPPQFGHTPWRCAVTQSRQKVRSNVQIIASGAVGGRSLSHHSQLGGSSSTTT